MRPKAKILTVITEVGRSCESGTVQIWTDVLEQRWLSRVYSFSVREGIYWRGRTAGLQTENHVLPVFNHFAI